MSVGLMTPLWQPRRRASLFGCIAAMTYE